MKPPEFVIEQWNVGLGQDEEGIENWCLRIDGSRIDYERSTGSKPAYWILLVGTAKDREGQGLATTVLDLFFREVVVKHPGTVYPGQFVEDERGRSLRGTFYRAAARYGFIGREGFGDGSVVYAALEDAEVADCY